MSTKDYVTIATALAYSCPCPKDSFFAIAYHRQWEHDCRSIANALHMDNFKFDLEKFLTACGLED